MRHTANFASMSRAQTWAASLEPTHYCIETPESNVVYISELQRISYRQGERERTLIWSKKENV